MTGHDRVGRSRRRGAYGLLLGSIAIAYACVYVPWWGEVTGRIAALVIALPAITAALFWEGLRPDSGLVARLVRADATASERRAAVYLRCLVCAAGCGMMYFAVIPLAIGCRRLLSGEPLVRRTVLVRHVRPSAWGAWYFSQRVDLTGPGVDGAYSLFFSFQKPPHEGDRVVVVLVPGSTLLAFMRRAP